MAQKIYIRSRTGGSYARAGFRWTGAWAEVDVSKLDKEQVALLKADVHLVIREKPPEEFIAAQEAPDFDAGETSRPADIQALEAENADLHKALEAARQGTHSVEAQVRASMSEASNEIERLRAQRQAMLAEHTSELADRDALIAQLREAVAALEAAAVAPPPAQTALAGSPAPKADESGKSKPKG